MSIRNLLLLCPLLFAFCSSKTNYKNIKSVKFDLNQAVGLGEENGVARRDPSDVIKIFDSYYVFYTKIDSDKNLYPSGYNGTINYAISKDNGYTWSEQGVVVSTGDNGKFDSFGAFTPNIIKGLDGQYYIYYTGVGDGFDNSDYSEKNRTAIGVARIVPGTNDRIRMITKLNDSEPILKPADAESGKFDSFRIDDASIVIRNNQYWLYYKGREFEKLPRETKMGVAVSDSPEGPFVKRNQGEPVQQEGHEVMVWPGQNGGVYSLVTNAGEGLYFSENGIQFSKILDKLSNKIHAGGCYRKDFEMRNYEAGPNWGLSMIHGKDPYLVRWKSADLLIN